MYINFKFLYSKNLTDTDFLVLQKIAQKETLLLEVHTKHLNNYLEQGLVQYLKGKENKLEGLRISKKGKELLRQVETPQFDDTIAELTENLIELYSTSQKYVGTKLEVQSRLLWFIAHTGFSPKVIEKTIEEYLTDNDTYTKSLENLIWCPPDKRFSKNKNLKNSLLFDLICKKYNLNQTFLLTKNNSTKMKWLEFFALLKVPKKLKESHYFTNSYKGDLSFCEKMKKEYLNNIKQK